MSEYIYGLPNPENDREMYEDPGMALYMSNKISAMENEYEEYEVKDITYLLESKSEQINQELGLEANAISNGLKRFWKFLKDNIMKFINFVCGFVMKFFKRSTDFVTFHKNAITSIKNLDKELSSLYEVLIAEGKTPMYKTNIVKDISNRVRYMTYVLSAVGVFIKTTIAEEYEVKKDDKKFTTPFYFMYAINALSLILEKIPDSSADDIDFEKINTSFTEIQKDILESFETYIERFDSKEDESKAKSLSAIYLVRSNIEKIRVSDVELNVYNFVPYNNTLLENIEKINFNASVTQVMDYGKEFKRIEQVRKETIELVKSMETVEDFSKYVKVSGLTFNETLPKKLNKLLLDSSSILTALNVLTTTTIETYVSDITEYISTTKAYIDDVKKDRFTPYWRKRLDEEAQDKN